MQLSYYTIVVDDYPRQGESLLYHTRTQAMVKVPGELLVLLRDIRGTSCFKERVRYAEDIVRLHDMGILVTDELEDLKKLAEFFYDMKKVRTDEKFSVTLLTTTACNFKCVYCFEEQARESRDMGFLTCGAVIHWLQQRLRQEGYKELHLNFYGGEPLLNREALEYAARVMQDWCRANNIGFAFSIQTNGYLLTKELVEYYLGLGLKSVRISLDGVREDHDCKRPLRNGGGTFDQIMKNVINAADLVRIDLAVSYDRRGVDHVARLLDYLEGLAVLKKLGRMICSPVHPSLGPAGKAGNIHHSSCLLNFNDDSLCQATLEINRLLEKKGLQPQRGLPVCACPVGREHGAITIDPDGRVYACNSMIGRPEFAVGDVTAGVHVDRCDNFLSKDPWKACVKDCPYLPVCGGGCRMMAFVEKGNFDSSYCKKAYLDKIAPELIKKEYEALISVKK